MESDKTEQPASVKKQVTIYTDGACSGNPGPGGYGAILIYGDSRREISGGYCSTTNNRMEMMAAIAALEMLKEPCQVRLFSDSRYLVDSIQKGWVYSWRKKNWKKSDKSRAANVDLWMRLLELLGRHQVTFSWVEGHAGHPENERCDELSVQALRSDSLQEDTGYVPNGSKHTRGEAGV